VACVLVHIEAEGDRPTAASLGALGAGRRLATRFGATLYAVVLTGAQSADSPPPDASIRIGPIDPGTLGRAPLVGELAKGGADKVVFVTAEVVHQPTLWATAGNALASACEVLRPLVVVVPTSRGGRDLAPRLAARLGAAYIPDGILDGGSGPAVVQRFVYGGHTRRWVLDDLDRVAVIAVADGTPRAKGDDDAEVMLLPAAGGADDRVQAAATPPDPAATAAPTAAATPAGGVAVLVRGLLSGPGTRAAAALGPSERAAIDAAVALGKARGAPVTAIAAGAGPIHDRALEAALAVGCARAIRVDAPIAEELDYLGLAQILAQAVRHVGADVTLCGDRSSDEATGAVGPAVAELIDAAHLTGVDAVERDGTTVVARRDRERFRIVPPAVLAIVAPATDAAAPEATAGTAAIEVVKLDALGLDSRVLTHRRATSGAITSTSTVETVPGIPVPDFGPEVP
jgi:electron transfer flavoprotein alpha/beta subunit